MHHVTMALKFRIASCFSGLLIGDVDIDRLVVVIPHRCGAETDTASPVTDGSTASDHVGQIIVPVNCMR